jgi:hypothetical protein
VKRKTLIALVTLVCIVACPLFFLLNKARAINFSTQVGPVTQQVVTASGAAQSNAATLTGSVGRMTYIEGFDITGGGATAASVIEVSTSGLTNNLKWEFNVLAGVTGPMNAQNGCYVRFPTPIPASATNTNITVTVPSFGAGNTNAAVTVYGFTQ